MQKYDVIIAIDPDVAKSGVACLARPSMLELDNLTFPELIDYLQYFRKEPEHVKKNMIIIVEAGWLNKSNWHVKNSDSKRVASAKGNSAGRNHEIGRKIIEIAEYYRLNVKAVPPLRKFWKGKDGKITHEELASFTGITGKTNQDARDAALLAWVYAELPIKVK